MATWAAQRAGNFATVSSDPASPWHDAGAQTALASIPAVGDTITNVGAFALTFNIDLPAVTSVLDSDTIYGVPGTYHAPLAAELIDTAVFGPSSATPGTVHQPEAAEVISTAVFGPASAVTGTFNEATRNTDPGVGNVIKDVAYKMANVAKTGTFDEAARNTDPGVANVVKDVAYKIANAAKVGTFDEAARNTDPGIATVLYGTAYKICNVDKTGTNTALASAGGGGVVVRSPVGIALRRVFGASA